eukprot:Rhum_TRINITY_DN14970_c4_g1::Rhum_TRINITY_DN14970_c4_g1_i1::g.130303::m.130303
MDACPEQAREATIPRAVWDPSQLCEEAKARATVCACRRTTTLRPLRLPALPLSPVKREHLPPRRPPQTTQTRACSAESTPAQATPLPAPLASRGTPPRPRSSPSPPRCRRRPPCATRTPSHRSPTRLRDRARRTPPPPLHRRRRRRLRSLRPPRECPLKPSAPASSSSPSSASPPAASGTPPAPRRTSRAGTRTPLRRLRSPEPPQPRPCTGGRVRAAAGGGGSWARRGGRPPGVCAATATGGPPPPPQPWRPSSRPRHPSASRRLHRRPSARRSTSAGARRSLPHTLQPSQPCAGMERWGTAGRQTLSLPLRKKKARDDSNEVQIL